MTLDEQYIQRCLQLAIKGRGYTSPNPMVGAVIVHQGLIIGEGYHRKCGEGHAEVNAINSVLDKSLLQESVIYVSLEPCSHYGKTPPCAQLIIDSKIPRVVIGCFDPYPSVSGRGVRMLQDAGHEVVVGVLETECLDVNKEFNTVYTKNRPYVYLKWAQSEDGFINHDKIEEKPAIISNKFTQILVHKLRAETDAIMVGTNTAVLDNPTLTTRLWRGTNSVRVILDRKCRVPSENHVLDDSVETIVFTESLEIKTNAKKTEYIYIDFEQNVFSAILNILREKDIHSIMIEGGSYLLQSIIDLNLWDEAFVEVSDVKFGSGVSAPHINANIVDELKWLSSKHIHFRLR